MVALSADLSAEMLVPLKAVVMVGKMVLTLVDQKVDVTVVELD
jgi:hypothetical protein